MLRKVRLADHVAHMEEKNSYKNDSCKPEGKKSLGKCRHRWEDNIKMHLK